MEQLPTTYAVKNQSKGLLWAYLGSVTLTVILISNPHIPWEAILILLICLAVLGGILSGVKLQTQRDKDWIQVTDSRLELYKKWEMAETIDAADVALMVVRPVQTLRTTFRQATITLYGEKRRELITLSANADNIDLLIDLVGRDKLLVKGQSKKR